MDISKKIPKGAALEVRDPGRRASGRKKSRQVLIRVDEAEVELLEFYREVTGGMSHARILKSCAIVGSQAFAYVYLLAKMDNVPDNEFSRHLTSVAQRAAKVFGEDMQRTYDQAKAEEANDDR